MQLDGFVDLSKNISREHTANQCDVLAFVWD